jgi:hypothetical protein
VKTGDGMGQSLALECGEQLLGRLRWVAEAFPLPFDGTANKAGGEIQQAGQEVVRMYGLDIEAAEHLRLEILQIVGHDDFGTGVDYGGQDVTVVGVGERQGIDQVLMPGHQAIADGRVDEGTGPYEPIEGELRVALQDVVDPLVVNRPGPPRPHDPRLSRPG